MKIVILHSASTGKIIAINVDQIICIEDECCGSVIYLYNGQILNVEESTETVVDQLTKNTKII
jgi:uncharacterized protein YlzI (FlbEa/FlbD family)